MGAEVRIVGSGFTNASDVEFNGVSVNSFNVISDTELVTLVPEGATRGLVTIVTPDGEISSTDDFRPLSPTILRFVPTTARAGDVISINGYLKLGNNNDISIKLNSSPLSASLALSFDLEAKAYLGLGGDWNYLGTYGVSYDSGSDQFCFGAKGYKISV